MIVTASVLNVRSGPGKDEFRVITQAKQGETVRVLDSWGDWRFVLPHHGWVHGSYLSAGTLTTPDGLSGLLVLLGNPGTPACSSGRCQLPEPLKLGWSDARISSAACHIELAETFTRVFHAIANAGMWNRLRTFDGIYNDRVQRTSTTKKSVHAWGAAVDINAATNKQGSRGDMPPKLVDVFTDHGFVWGGTFLTPDPMHFQFVHNY